VLAVGQRLRRRDEFTSAIRAGRRAARGGVVVHLADNSTRPALSARAGFVVPKAVGGAVVRNRVRRQLRHLIRDRLTDLPPGTDVVVRVLPAAVGRSYQQLGSDLTQALAVALGERRERGRSGADCDLAQDGNAGPAGSVVTSVGKRASDGTRKGAAT
jgi:ribonuclease P protein component